MILRQCISRLERFGNCVGSMEQMSKASKTSGVDDRCSFSYLSILHLLNYFNNLFSFFFFPENLL